MSDIGAIPPQEDSEFKRILAKAESPPFKLGLWCHYCQKNNHSDDTCWSTRPANWKPTDKRLCVCSGTPQTLRISGPVCSFCGGRGWI